MKRERVRVMKELIIPQIIHIRFVNEERFRNKSYSMRYKRCFPAACVPYLTKKSRFSVVDYTGAILFRELLNKEQTLIAAANLYLMINIDELALN